MSDVIIIYKENDEWIVKHQDKNGKQLNVGAFLTTGSALKYTKKLQKQYLVNNIIYRG